AFQSTLTESEATAFFGKTFDYIFSILQALLVQLQLETEDAGKKSQDIVDEASIAAKIHQATVLAPFFKKYKNLRSNAICLSCLADRPRYSLKCEHSICDACLKYYGTTEN